MPKTSSGKIKRYACKKSFLEGTLKIIGEWRANYEKTPVFATDAADQLLPANIKTWLLSKMAAQLKVPFGEISARHSFMHYGLDSLQLVSLAGELEAWLGRQLSPTLLYEYPTIEALAHYLGEEANTSKPVSMLEPIPWTEFNHSGASIQSLEMVKQANESAVEANPKWSIQAKTESDTATTSPSATRTNRCNLIIESLGVYLPPKVVSTEEILQGCKKQFTFPLERATGIKNRRMAGETIFAIDLAKKAIADCLAKSKYDRESIEILVCCNVSRYDAPNKYFFEPSTSMRLKKYFGFDNALVFDVSNACAGMFTAIEIVNAFIKTGLIQCGLVVSGEYISHVTQTAQKEIYGSMDPRLACLTLGDAGIAMILEKSPSDTIGFHDIDIFTMSQYSSLCIGKATDKEHGGAIMFTDSIKQAVIGIKETIRHSEHIVNRNGWSLDDCQHIIMHQTSESSLRSAARVISDLVQDPNPYESKVIYNIAQRGNTATTTHFVAVSDNILNNRIKSGDKVLFGITGSGMSIGTALYTFDDLPDRIRLNQQLPSKKQQRITHLSPAHNTPRVRIANVGTIPEGQYVDRDTIELVKVAAKNCFENSSTKPSDIDLLIHAGVYRNEFLSEPAIAAFVANELGINNTDSSINHVFAFDIFNSGIGFLNACHVATQFLKGQRFTKAMIVAGEIENNARSFPDRLYGLKETGSAMLLEESSDNETGFGNFIFQYEPALIDAITSYSGHENGKTCLRVEREADLEDYYLESIPKAVHALLAMEGLDISLIKLFFPPQISKAFPSKLSQKMGIDEKRFVNACSDDANYFTSSLVYALQYAYKHNLVKKGDIGLFISVGAGIQVGCAIYYF